MSDEKVKGVVDLVFLMDITGSMQDCIDALKSNIKAFFDSLTRDEANGAPIRDWRAKVVGFRDYSYDKEKWLENNPWRRDVGALYTDIDSLKAKGGGDEPESLLDALLVLLDAGELTAQENEDADKWRPRHAAARAIVVFTDASYHLEAANPKYAGAQVADVRTKIQANRIILTVVTPGVSEDKNVNLEGPYAELCAADKAEYIALADKDSGEPITFEQMNKSRDMFKDFLEKLAKTLSKSVEVIIL